MEITYNNTENKKHINKETQKNDNHCENIDQKIKELQLNLENAQKNINDIKLRQLAEIENIEKNTKHIIKKIKMIEKETFFKKVLSIVDNFEDTLTLAKNVQLKNEPIIEGINLILQSLSNNLYKLGVISEGKKNEIFNPNIHECIEKKISEHIPNNHIIQVHKKGYTWKTITLRKAIVTISNKKE